MSGWRTRLAPGLAVAVALWTSGCVLPGDFEATTSTTTTTTGDVSVDTSVDADTSSGACTAAQKSMCNLTETCAVVDGSAVCFDSTEDEQRCGPSAMVCEAETVCDGGVCSACPSGLAACSIADMGRQRACFDITSDADHCGACERRCGTDDECVDGECTLDLRSITAGKAHTCAIAGDRGIVYCWGSNSNGQVSPRTAVDGAYPVAVELPGLAVANCLPGKVCARDIAAGDAHTCAVTISGDILCWGLNDLTQLGAVASPTAQVVALRVNSLSETFNVDAIDEVVDIEASSFASIVAGQDHTCALTRAAASSTATSIWCWGSNDKGQLGHMSDSGEPEAVDVVAVEAWQALGAGARHTCGISDGGEAYCWGDNEHGQAQPLSTPIDCPASTCVPTLVAATMARPVVAIDGGLSHTCALADDSEVICWGENDARLGHDRLGGQPEDVGLGVGQTAVATGQDFTCVGGEAGISCFGDVAMQMGQLGGSTRTTAVSGLPTELGLPNEARIAAGEAHTCVVGVNGTAWCWGSDSNCQLGRGAECELGSDSESPVRVVAPAP